MPRKSTSLPGQDPMFTINPEHGNVTFFPAELDRQAQEVKINSGIPIERQLLVARNIVNVLDIMSHVSKLHGLDYAADSDKHRPHLVESIGHSELKLNSTVNGAFNKAMRLEAEVDKNFMSILGLLGVIRPDMAPEEKVDTYDNAWGIFSRKYSGPDGQIAREKTRDSLASKYKAYTGREMPRTFKSEQKKFAEERQIKKAILGF